MRLSQLVALLVSALAISPAAVAQAYPSKPIHIIGSLAAGGGVDSTARIVGQKLTEAWAQPVIIENRPGAGGTIAAEAVARAAPDGYTLLITSPGHASASSLYKLAFDPIRDFAPITIIVVSPSVLVVHPSVPARSVKELITLARSRPDELTFGSSGNGSPGHMTVELLKLQTGAKMLHVPYKGTPPIITDLVGGRISASASSVVTTMPHVHAGRLRALAVTSSKRSLAAPDLPTVAESGVPGFGVDVWYALLGPAAMPRSIVIKLHQGVLNVIGQPDVRQRMLGAGLEPVGSSPDASAAYVRAEVAKWSKVIRSAGIRPD